MPQPEEMQTSQLKGHILPMKETSFAGLQRAAQKVFEETQSPSVQNDIPSVEEVETRTLFVDRVMDP